MDFLEITRQFEDRVGADYKFELLELNFLAYALGHGTKAYRINGRNFAIVFDGRDQIVEVKVSNRHEKYPSSTWTSIFRGTSEEFLDKGFKEIRRAIKE